jgi:hypothetical protein
VTRRAWRGTCGAFFLLSIVQLASGKLAGAAPPAFCHNNTYGQHKIDSQWLGCEAPQMVRWVNDQPIGVAFDGSDGITDNPKMRQTRATDSLPAFEYTPTKMVGWGVGKGGPIAYVLKYDAAHSIVTYVTPIGGSWSQTVVEYVSTAPPVPFPKIDLIKGYVSTKGVGLGSTIAAVARIFGKPNLINLGHGLTVAYYERKNGAGVGHGGSSDQTAFVFRSGHVIGMSYAGGG